MPTHYDQSHFAMLHRQRMKQDEDHAFAVFLIALTILMWTLLSLTL
jgi:hypothetical protein